MVWNPLVTGATSLLSEFPSTMTTQAIAFRQGIEQYSLWSDAGGTQAGQPRAGACRAFFDVASNLSSTLSATKPLDGRLYVTSDTTRLYGYLSGRTVLLGSANAITFWQDTSTIGSDQRALVQVGTSGITLASRTTIPFATSYVAGNVFVQLMPMSSSTLVLWNPTLLSSNTTNFVVQGRFVYGSASTVTLMWRAHGVATL